MAFGKGQESKEGSNFPKYVGVGSFKIIDVNIDSELIFTIQVSAENQTGWTIAGAAVKIKLDDGGWTKYNSTLLDESNIWVYEGAIPPNINIIYYEITPKLYYPSTTYEISEFPIDYQKKYTLLGQFSTNSGIVDLKISLSEEDFDCDEGYKVYNKIKIFINNNNSTHRQAHCLVAHKAHTPAKTAKELASPHSDFPTRKN